MYRQRVTVDQDFAVRMLVRPAHRDMGTLAMASPAALPPVGLPIVLRDDAVHRGRTSMKQAQ
jgi:hypothetical protein